MIKLHQKQSEIAKCTKRFKVFRAGRRTGKTIYFAEEMKGASVLKKEARVLYIAPTIGQARDIMWLHLKQEFKNAGAKFNESRLEIETPTKFKNKKSYIKLSGWENIDVLRGQSYDLIVMDELDSMDNFLQEFQETVKPLVLDRKGSIIFGGTPKDSNPNLQSLEDKYKDDPDWGFFHATSYDNPYIDHSEIDKEKEALSPQSFRQEWLAEYGDGSTKLFDPIAVNDMFTVILSNNDDTAYLTIDPAGLGEDTTVFTRWVGYEAYVEQYKKMTSDDIEDKILKYEAQYQIPRANIMLDAVGLGDSIGDRARLRGITIFKGSYSPVKTDKDISKIDTGIKELKPTKSDFLNLRTQTYFALSSAIMNRRIKVNCSVEQAEKIKRELNATVELEGKAKRQLIPKEEIKRIIGHSPDLSDTLAMRMYYGIITRVNSDIQVPDEILNRQQEILKRNRNRQIFNSTR